MLSSPVFWTGALLAVAAPVTPPAPDYSALEIEHLVQSGAAVPHGAQFAVAQGALNSRTFLWEESRDHHVFFFLRDGKSHGEYREERLANGRLLRITENYLVLEARASAPFATAKHRFIVRDQQLHWEAGKWTGSDVHWSFIAHAARDGEESVRLEKAIKEYLIKRNITLKVPRALTGPAAAYSIRAYRPLATEYERAFGDHIEDNRYRLDEGQVSNGSCTLALEWPETRDALVFELHERLPADPLDANPSLVHTRLLGSMTVSGSELATGAIAFKPR